MKHHEIDEITKEIGRKIRVLRESLGLGTREFAKGIHGLQSSNLSEIERGNRRPTVPMLLGIKRKYHVALDDLAPGKKPQIRGRKVRWIPILTCEQASLFLSGDPRFEEEIPVGHGATENDDTRAFFLSIGDNKLEELGISKGDIVLVEPENVEIDNRIVFSICIPDEELGCHMVLKKCHLDASGGVVLLGGNSGAQVRLSKQEAAKCKFHRVVSVTKAV